jgi:hypothetical protein
MHFVVLGVLGIDLPQELPPKSCLQEFAHVLNRLFMRSITVLVYLLVVLRLVCRIKFFSVLGSLTCADTWIAS